MSKTKNIADQLKEARRNQPKVTLAEAQKQAKEVMTVAPESKGFKLPDPPELEEINCDQIISFEEIPENSALIFRTSKDTAEMARAFESLIERYRHIIAARKISIFVLDSNSTMELLDEAQMLKCGWIRKLENKIIT